MAYRSYLSVIVPQWNEKESLPAFIDRFDDVFRDFKDSYELLIVDDGSTDGSYDLLRAAQATRQYLSIIKLNGHYGRDAALVAGLRFSTGQYAATISADLQYDPADIPKMLEIARKSNPDIVCGYVEAPPGHAEYRHADFVRYDNATGGRLKDPICSLRLISRNLIERAQQYHGNTYNASVLLPRMAKRFEQVPVVRSPRKHGSNRLLRGPNSLPKVLGETWLRYEMAMWGVVSAGLLVALSTLVFTLYTFLMPGGGLPGIPPTDIDTRMLLLLAIVGFFGGCGLALMAHASRANAIYSLPLPEPVRYESADVYSAPRPARPEGQPPRDRSREQRQPRPNSQTRQQQQRQPRPQRSEEEAAKPPAPTGPVTFESVIFLQSENERPNGNDRSSNTDAQEPRNDGNPRPRRRRYPPRYRRFPRTDEQGGGRQEGGQDSGQSDSHYEGNGGDSQQP